MRVDEKEIVWLDAHRYILDDKYMYDTRKPGIKEDVSHFIKVMGYETLKRVLCHAAEEKGNVQ